MESIHKYVPSFNFMLLVDGAFEVPLKSVQAFSRDNEYEPIQEGGQNDYVYLKRKPISQPFKLVVERYVDYSLSITDPLTNGAELLLPLLLFVGKNIGGQVDGARYYSFTGCVVMGKTFGALDAERSGLLTETITIGYNHMFCVGFPTAENFDYEAYNYAEDQLSRKYSKRGFEPAQSRWNDITLSYLDTTNNRDKSKLWIFDGTSKGQGTRSRSNKMDTVNSEKAEQRGYIFAADNNPNYPGDKSKSTRSAQNTLYGDKELHPDDALIELSKTEMINKAVKFEWDEDGLYTGNGVRPSTRNNPITEPRYDEMVSKAIGWKISNDKSKEGSGERRAQNNLVTSETTLPDGTVIKGELSQKDMEELSKRWRFPKEGDKDGTNTESSKSSAWKPEGINEKSLNDFIDSGKKWDFEKYSNDGSDSEMRSRQNAVTDDEGTVISGMGTAEVSKEKMVQAAKKWAFENNKYAVKGNGIQSAWEPEDLNTGNLESFKEDAKRWKIKADGSKDGEGDRSRQNAVFDKDGNLVSGMGSAELDKKAMIAGAKKWEFTDKYSKEGGGISSRQAPDTKEPYKDTMEKAAHRWDFDKDEKSVQGKGTQSAWMPENLNTGDTGSFIDKAKRWKFDEKEPATKQGQGDSSRKMPDIAEKTQESMASGAHKWEFEDKNTYKGKGTQSAWEPEELNKGDTASFSGNAQKWEFDEKEPATKQGQGTASRIPSPVPELSREDMEKRAVRHVKQSITDFLMG